jgi:hypothetical protein
MGSNRPHHSPLLRRTLVAAAIALAGSSAGCGGSGGGSGPSAATELSFGVTWEQPAPSAVRRALKALRSASAGFDTPIPPAVGTIRFTFRPPSPGQACCIAVTRGSAPFIERSLLLADVAPGVGSLEVTAFPGDFAPADGVTALCATRPAGQGEPCDGEREALPSYGSDEVPVNILPSQRNRVDIEVHSLPFLLDLDPDDGETADEARPDVFFTVVDAAHGIDPDVGVRMTRNNVPREADIVSSTECSDFAGDGLPACSQGGALQVRGLEIHARSPEVLPQGQAALRIQANNDASPARSVVSNTVFTVPAVQVTTTTSTTVTTLDTTTTTSTTTTTLEPTTTTTTTSTTSTTTTTNTTTTTMEPLVEFCVNFTIPQTLDLLGVSFDVSYANAAGGFVGAGSAVECFSPIFGAIESYNDDEASRTLSGAVATAEPFTAPLTVATCFFAATSEPDVATFSATVTEATAPDFTPANVTIVVENTACPL